MKLKRAKKTRKTLQYYRNHFNIVPPYKVVVDSEFIQSALIGRIQLKEQLPKVLQLDNSLVSHITKTIQSRVTNTDMHNTVQSINITRCILRSIELKGNLYGGALFIAKKLNFLSCRHKAKHVSEHDCIKALLYNNNIDRLICGLNDKKLRSETRSYGHTPVMFIHDNVVVMEEPTLRNKQQLVNNTLHNVNEIQPDVAKVVEKIQGDDTTDNTSNHGYNIQHKKRKAGGPNPLSVKKSKKQIEAKQAAIEQRNHEKLEHQLRKQQPEQPQINTDTVQRDNNNSYNTDHVNTATDNQHTQTINNNNNNIDTTNDTDEPQVNIIEGKRKRKRVRHRKSKNKTDDSNGNAANKLHDNNSNDSDTDS